MSEIETKLAQAEDTMDLLSVLEGVTVDDVPGMRRHIPKLASHHYWLIRSEVMDLIGELGLEEFLNILQAGLEDRNRIVRCYALDSYYRVKRKDALGVIRAMCKHRDVRTRVAALCLLYVDRREKDALRKLRRILVRSRCIYFHQSVALHILQGYGMLGDPDVRALFVDVRAKVRPDLGIAKELDEVLQSNKPTG